MSRYIGGWLWRVFIFAEFFTPVINTEILYLHTSGSVVTSIAGNRLPPYIVRKSKSTKY